MTEILGRFDTFESAARAHVSGDYQYIQHDGTAWVLFRDPSIWGESLSD